MSNIKTNLFLLDNYSGTSTYSGVKSVGDILGNLTLENTLIEFRLRTEFNLFYALSNMPGTEIASYPSNLN